MYTKFTFIQSCIP